jgi:hypothetical protein
VCGKAVVAIGDLAHDQLDDFDLAAAQAPFRPICCAAAG